MQLSSFLLVGLALNSYCYKLWQPNFRCFAMNFVEAKDGMLILSFLDEIRGSILMVFLKEKRNMAFTLFNIARNSERLSLPSTADIFRKQDGGNDS